MEKTTIVIPAYNEDINVLTEVIHNLLPLHYTIAVVDDGSETPLALALRHLSVTVLTHSVNLGQGAAIQTGLMYAAKINSDYALTFDADGQHTIKDIEPLLIPLRKGTADITIGSRFLSGGIHNATFLRRLVFSVAKKVNRFLFNVPFSDTHNGLRAMNRLALRKIKISENRMAHASEILHQVMEHRLRYKEVPVQIRYTPYSRRKGQQLSDSIKIFFDLILHKLFK